MTLKVYNTLTKKSENFEPLNGKKVSMYVCGITPYDSCHIGHARCYVAFDVIRRYLEHKGYTLNYVQNFTDIDDKIIKKAHAESLPFKDIAERYINDFLKNMDVLNIKRANKNPKVSDNINEIITAVTILIKKNFAYELAGDVYFRVKKFKNYGKLSKRNIEEMQNGARVIVNDKKETPMDFALWKKAKKNEPSWASPWGEGRPGWHIECSVLSILHLGETIDIHGGGADLIFPHHENEVAQSEALTTKTFAKYWLHNGFVMINKEKMSKSLDNFFSVDDILQKYHPMVLRLFLLTNHYKKPLDFSTNKLEENKRRMQKFINFLEILSNFQGKAEITPDITKLENEFYQAMDNDFNTAAALAVLHKLLEYGNKHKDISPKKAQAALIKIKNLALILGVKFELPKKNFPAEINSILKERLEARKNQDWQKADDLKNKLLDKGYEIKDTKSGIEIWKI
ncbi:MAG: cysteine--tRNA ligase [Bacteroidetes bacterium]|nr:cysteine--tRNA ligase [Bacteroidota bacterium]